MLKFFKKFIKTYVDDIIIYSRILIEHVIHLIKIFDLFFVKQVNLASIESYLKYLSIILLNQKINSLNMFISAKKIVVIIAFRFSNNLKKIDHFLDLIKYLRSSIFKYVQRVNSLQKKKSFSLNNCLTSRNFLKNKKSLKCVFKIQFTMKNNHLKIFKVLLMNFNF